MKKKNYLNNYNLSNKLVFVIGGNGQIGSETINALIECNVSYVTLDTKKSKLIIKIIFTNFFDCTKLNSFK